jgi:propanol-preferring alcohol dehydrogenase
MFALHFRAIMRAVVLKNPKAVEENPLVATEIPIPKPRPTQVLVKVAACGVCRTDVHIAEGEIAAPKLPLVLGHQIVGDIVERGVGARKLREGERIGVTWLSWLCGCCPFCNRGRENLCENGRFTGMHVDGGFAEYAVVEEDFAFPLPTAFGDAAAAPLLCAGVIGMRAFRLCELPKTGRLGLFGFGSSAHLVLQIAKFLMHEVYVFTRSAGHRKVATELGADFVGGAEDLPPRMMDAAIIFAPSGQLVPLALEKLTRGGVLVLAGIHMSPIPEMPYALLYHERMIRSAANATREDVRNLLGFARDIPLQTEVETYPLADANRALQAVKHSRSRASVVLTV